MREIKAFQKPSARTDDDARDGGRELILTDHGARRCLIKIDNGQYHKLKSLSVAITVEIISIYIYPMYGYIPCHKLSDGGYLEPHISFILFVHLNLIFSTIGSLNLVNGLT